MPLNLPDDLPKNFPNPNYLTLGNFKRGVISLLDRSRLPKDALEQADNIFLVEDGQPTLRPGVDWYGAASPNGEPWDGMDYFDFGGVIHLVGVAGGTVYRSTDDAANWTACTGYTLTADLPVYMNQYNDYLYLTNGTDPITLYDGSTTLSRYTSLSTPGVADAVETALTGTGNKYYYKVARVSDIGYSVSSAKNTLSGVAGTVESSLARTSWVAGTNYVTLTTPNGVAGQTRWDIYLSTDDSNYYYLSSVAATNGATSTFVDDGTGVVVPTATAPDTNTSEGPLVKELKNVGSRMYGVRDTVNRYRMWFSSGSIPYGLFAGDDGGYLDWALGGKYIPVQIEDYRDGKGTPLATVWCDSADGQGCILQMSLDTVTIADISITVPSAYKLPGSRGTPAPGSVINVLNDYMFYNSQAFYNLGSRVNFQNLLSTDEASGNIRPSVKQINTAAVDGICSVYSDAKVYFSVPYGSDTNNAVVVYDTERKAWLPYAFTIGFKKFLKYTDTDGNHRLLAIKPGDNKLSEISFSIKGDYGVAFESVLMTGLYNTTKNRFEFQWTEEAEMEFSNPAGTIIVELLGLERSRGFRTQASANITGGSSATTGWDSFSFDSTPWDDTSNVVEAYAESSVKKYFRLGKELNAVQWRITTNSLDANYILRTLQTWGTDTAGGKPRSWRITRT